MRVPVLRQNVKERPSVGALIDAVRFDLDALHADVDRGIPSSAHFDQFEHRAQAIAGRLRDAFRKGTC